MNKFKKIALSVAGVAVVGGLGYAIYRGLKGDLPGAAQAAVDAFEAASDAVTETVETVSDQV